MGIFHITKNGMPPYVFQKAVFRLAKDGLSGCNMPSFAMQKTVFWKAKDNILKIRILQNRIFYVSSQPYHTR